MCGVSSCVPGTACLFSVPVSTLACGVLLERALVRLAVSVPVSVRFLACCWSVPPRRVLVLACCVSVPGIFLLRFTCCLACLAPIVLTHVWRVFSVPGSYAITFFLSAHLVVGESAQPRNRVMAAAVRQLSRISRRDFPDLFLPQAQEG
jgi:hypothetical protein